MNPEILKYIETHALGQTRYGYGSGAEAKIAKTVMIELVKAGHADFLLLRDDVVSKWWGKMVTAAQKAIDDEAKKQGRTSTILTSGAGASGTAPTSKKTLLGQ